MYIKNALHTYSQVIRGLESTEHPLSAPLIVNAVAAEFMPVQP